MTIQLTLDGKCAHLHTRDSGYMGSGAKTCIDCDDQYVYTVCRNNITTQRYIPV